MFMRQLGHLLRQHLDPWRSPASLQSRSQAALRQTLRHAFDTNPFHGERWRALGIKRADLDVPDALARLPVMTKQDVRAYGETLLLSRGADLTRGRVKYSSGSSGEPVRIFLPEATFDAYLPLQFRVFSMLGCRPWHTIAYIKANGESTPSYFGMFRAEHIPSGAPVEEQIARLRALRPHVISAYPSSLLAIIDALGGASLGYRPVAVSVNTEMSTAAQRDQIAKAFGCPVGDDYGTEEVWMIASHCLHGGLHVFTDNVVVEIVDGDGRPCPPGQAGDVLLTSLTNPTMPFIRYAIGDRATFSDAVCTCGRGFPLLATFEGRSNDAFVLADGRTVSAAQVHTVLYGPAFQAASARTMRGFRVIQERVDHVRLQVAGDGEGLVAAVELVRDGLGALLGPTVHIDVERVDEIPRNAGGKLQAVVSRVPRAPAP